MTLVLTHKPGPDKAEDLLLYLNWNRLNGSGVASGPPVTAQFTYYIQSQFHNR